MGLIFAANSGTRLRTGSVPYDSLGGTNDLDIAIQFYLEGSTGTSARNIVAKGSNFFVLRRKAGTTNELQLVHRSTSAVITTMELGSVSLDEWHVMRFRWNGSSQEVFIDGSSVQTSSVASTWVDDNGSFWQVGSSITSNGIGMRIGQIAGWNTALSTADAALVDSGTTLWSDTDTGSKTEWFYFNFLQTTSGSAANTDPDFDNQNTDAASLGDIILWTGTAPTYDSSTPISEDEPPVSSEKASIYNTGLPHIKDNISHLPHIF